MEIIIAIAVVVIVGGYFIYKRADKNGDGKVDAVETQAAVEEVKVVVQETAAKVEEEVKTVAKKAAVKAKSTAKRVTTAAKRAPAKKK
jgi:hypothetical protein